MATMTIKNQEGCHISSNHLKPSINTSIKIVKVIDTLTAYHNSRNFLSRNMVSWNIRIIFVVPMWILLHVYCWVSNGWCPRLQTPCCLWHHFSSS
jgi:hypothetical protein